MTADAIPYPTGPGPDTKPSTAGLGAELHFRGEFRRYQTSMLDLVEAHPATDRRYHLVAPPGSGKTLIGLELIRRFDRPAVVFSPTTTIQGQWLDKVGWFTEDPARFASRDPTVIRPMNIYTYQLISTPAAATEELRELAVDAWVKDSAAILVGEADLVRARDRIERMAIANPDAYGREVASRVRRVRKSLLAADGEMVYDQLHANARALIDRLSAANVGTVVLDECHHLLDYWAIVLRALISRLAQPHVIGLTATLPSLEDSDAYENYTSLLGDVDFEIPTPAVIKEGDLAPFRDLAWWVGPTTREHAYLRDVERRFQAAVDETVGSPGFTRWLTNLVGDPPPTEAHPAMALAELPGSREAPEPVMAPPSPGTFGSDPLAWTGPDGRWERWAFDHTALAQAAVRAASQGELALGNSATLLLTELGETVPSFEDWLVLLEQFALQHLKLSERREDHAALASLRRAIAPFGLTLTEGGLRQGRSVTDLVLSFSESKSLAAVDVLGLEHDAMGSRLRAVVVTDFERLASGANRTRGALDSDAGSAFRAFAAMAADSRTSVLNPVLLTGTTVRTTLDFGNQLRDDLASAALAAGLHLRLRVGAGDGHAEILADGPDWRPGTYVALATKVFEAGRCQVLVGTRALLGEGWDAPSANTLVDLTSVTTATGVQQLRGRILRLDPAWPEKVAHAYDIVCTDPALPRGGIEFERLVRRHDRTWGIVPSGKNAGDVVRGLGHLDPGLQDELMKASALEQLRSISTVGIVAVREQWQLVDRTAVNGRTAAAMAQRADVRALWRIGQPYDNATAWFNRLRLREPQFRTVGTVLDTVRSLVIRVASILLAGVGLGSVVMAYAGEPLVALGVTLVGTVISVSVNRRTIARLVRMLLLEQPPDAIVGDAARAVLGALRRTNQVSGRLTNEALAVTSLPDGSISVEVRDRWAGDDSAILARALDQLFAPIGSPRYLIRRDDGRLPSMKFQVVWLLIRAMFRREGRERPVYHAVPDALGTHRDRAEAFAHEWRRWVGGGQLVLCRSEEGRRVLGAARLDRRPVADRLLTEHWR